MNPYGQRRRPMGYGPQPMMPQQMMPGFNAGPTGPLGGPMQPGQMQQMLPPGQQQQQQQQPLSAEDQALQAMHQRQHLASQGFELVGRASSGSLGSSMCCSSARW